MADSQEQSLIRLGGLWEKRKRDGEMFFAGSFGSMCRLVIFRNGYKKHETQPDWIMYIEEKSATTADSSAGSAERKPQ